MDIHTKYDVGDTVWFNWPTSRNVECSVCEGQKTIEHKGCTYRCPNCNGRGMVASKKMIEVPLLGEIKQFVTDCEGTDCVVTSNCCEHLTDETDCYPTEAEAQAAADKLNEESK